MIETLALCEHQVPIKFGCQRCTEKLLHQSDSNQLDLIAHCQDGIDKCFERIEGLEIEIKFLMSLHKNNMKILSSFHDDYYYLLQEKIKLTNRIESLQGKANEKS
jgi:hypothetical protein